MTGDITIAAPILARNEEEAEFLAGSVERLAAHGPVILADGGSIDGFTRRLSSIAGVEVYSTAGEGPRLAAQVNQALTTASDRDCRYVLYTEPDKRWFFENGLAQFLTARPEDLSAPGVYLPARDTKSFESFPPGQQLPEKLFNTLAADTLGVETDFLYGPLLIQRDLVPVLEGLPPDIGWGWRIFLLTAAVRLGQSFTTWEAYLPCPPEQQGEDNERSRTYRLEQMAQNVRGLALGRRIFPPK